MKSGKDTVIGVVVEVTDGDSFCIETRSLGVHNKGTYDKVERIIVTGIDIRSPNQDTEDTLKKRILGREVECYIHGRDEKGRLISEYDILK